MERKKGDKQRWERDRDTRRASSWVNGPQRKFSRGQKSPDIHGQEEKIGKDGKNEENKKEEGKKKKEKRKEMKKEKNKKKEKRKKGKKVRKKERKKERK